MSDIQTVTAGEAIVRVLEAENVRFVFGLPGGHILSVYDGLFRSEQIRHVLVRHEQTAASMAAAHAQLTGEPGICLVTAGPGCTNLLTGIAEAYVGALPVIIIAARAGANIAQRGAAQEVHTDRVFAPVTKWSIRVDRADLLVDVLRQAFVVARSGKPGPVLIDIPRDLLPLPVPFPAYSPVGRPPLPQPDTGAVARAAAALAEARAPIIVAGGGAVAADAQREIRELAELLAAPVLTSLSGRGSISDDHPLSAGGLGAHRNPLSRRLLAEADCVLGLGTRFEEMETNWKPGFVPAPEATYIQVDTDPAELGRSVVPAIPILGDARATAAAIVAAIRERGAALAPGAWQTHGRVQSCLEARHEIEEEAVATATARQTPIHALAVVQAARRIFPRETTVAIDVGVLAQQMAGAFPFFKIYEPRSTIVCSSFYGMGFATGGLPAAKLIHPNRPAIGFVGDGSFQMAFNVLPAAVENKLAVTWCVLDDEALGSIMDIQQYAYGNRLLGTTFPTQPDFGALARACGCHGETVTEFGEIDRALVRALEANANGQPAVVSFKVGRDRLAQTYEFYPFYALRT